MEVPFDRLSVQHAVDRSDKSVSLSKEHSKHRAFRVFKNEGILAVEHYSKDGKRGELQWKPSGNQLRDHPRYRVTSDKISKPHANDAKVRMELTKGPLYADFFFEVEKYKEAGKSVAPHTGVLLEPDEYDNELFSSHSVCIYGFGIFRSRLNNKTTPYYIYRNTYGNDWGDCGWGRIEYKSVSAVYVLRVSKSVPELNILPMADAFSFPPPLEPPPPFTESSRFSEFARAKSSSSQGDSSHTGATDLKRKREMNTECPHKDAKSDSLSSASERLTSNTTEPLLTAGDALDKYQIISEKDILAEVLGFIARCISRDEAALAVAQKAFKGLYENAQNNAHGDSHLAIFASIRDVSKLVFKELTGWVIYSDEDRKYNKDITFSLIQRELLNLAEYNIHIAKMLDAGKNKMVTAFAMSFIQALVIGDSRVISKLQNLADAKSEPPKLGEKFFGNFPYPYMNGYLHLSHAFSVSKVAFDTAYHRLSGANLWFPFGFHYTGMPIKGLADKLAREIERFGNPPVFPSAIIEEKISETEVKPSDGNNQGAPYKFKGKKSKAVSMAGGQTYQWEIMHSYGLSDEEIAKFQDPRHWHIYFPPLAEDDLKAFGLGCDWRGSLITTDINSFIDSFIRWQTRKLKEMGKIVKDLRYTIYSPLEGQPCAHHDWASGDVVIPQEYTLIKMEVVPPFPPKFGAFEGRKVDLAAVTLRPETMYGQTNSWALPDGKYGAFGSNEIDVFILTERAARNFAYQRVSRVPGKPTCLVELTGNDQIGLPLRSLFSFKEIINCLPILSILTDKRIGIVTSVPRDLPDDLMALQDLISKPAFRANFGVKDEWVLFFEIIPIISTLNYGEKLTEKICTDMKIKSRSETEKFDAAKKAIMINRPAKKECCIVQTLCAAQQKAG